jgi:hypothetical protein
MAEIVAMKRIKEIQFIFYLGDLDISVKETPGFHFDCA